MKYWWGRSSFNPKQLSGLSLWFDPSDASTIVFGTGSSIQTYKDKSVNGNNAVQNTAANQLSLVTGNSPTGLNTVQGVAANSPFMLLNNSITFAAYTVFAVEHKVNSTDNIEIFGGATATIGGGGEWFTGDLVFGYDSNLNVFFPTAGVSLASGSSSWHVVGAFSAADGTLGHNGILIDGNTTIPATSTAATQGAWTQIFHGDSKFTNGFVGEILYYNRVLAAAEISMVSSYLRRKWGTP